MPASTLGRYVENPRVAARSTQESRVNPARPINTFISLSSITTNHEVEHTSHGHVRAGRKPFRSVGFCYLLYCVPGTISEKAVAFEHVSALPAPGARVFGATVVQGNLRRSKVAHASMDVYNRNGIFLERQRYLGRP